MCVSTFEKICNNSYISFVKYFFTVLQMFKEKNCTFFNDDTKNKKPIEHSKRDLTFREK